MNTLYDMIKSAHLYIIQYATN